VTVCRGIRGAITVAENTRDDILQATDELLRQLVKANEIDDHQVAAVFFTTTSDLNAEFPAVAARQIGWDRVALMCSHEMMVPNSLSKCVRVLILVNTEKTDRELVHVYLREAKRLRTDLAPDA
jgi:chorismate mutase